ncbi:hypothetical protein GTA08_BOTSDO08683 [Neofusicoccum parvum]|nr:hypothetical protein GTA08_BOTSDO08683 [Neofusicoccum parvum]
MQRSTRRKPERKDQYPPHSTYFLTCIRELRAAARALDKTSASDDQFFTQFKNTIKADTRELQKTIQTKQQDAINTDAAFLNQIRGPIADALRPRPTITQRSSTVNAPTLPQADACPLIAAGAHFLQLSKHLLASYDEAAKVIDGDEDGLKDSGRLGDRWPADVEKVRKLLDVGYKKAQGDVAKVLRGHDGGNYGGGEADAAKTGEQDGGTKQREELDAFFGSGREKQEDRERFNVAQSLYEATRGVRRLSRSVPNEPLE